MSSLYFAGEKDNMIEYTSNNIMTNIESISEAKIQKHMTERYKNIINIRKIDDYIIPLIEHRNITIEENG